MRHHGLVDLVRVKAKKIARELEFAFAETEALHSASHRSSTKRLLTPHLHNDASQHATVCNPWVPPYRCVCVLQRPRLPLVAFM